MRPLLLDSNLLLVLLAGECDSSKLGVVKGLKEYSESHLTWISGFYKVASSILTVPNVLTEVSDIMGEDDRLIVRGMDHAFAKFSNNVCEVYYPSRDIVGKANFWKVGLSDAVILECIEDRNACLLTTDHKLYGLAQSITSEVYNLWHYYSPDWATG